MSSKRTLILAEKPGVAKDISDVLGRFARKNGHIVNESYVITWAIGHLAELAAPEDYSLALKKWSVDTLPIIPDSFFIKPVEAKKRHFSVVKSLLNRSDVFEIINACDAGREGELIFRYIYYLAGCRKPVRRLWLSENTPEAIRFALSRLQSGKLYDFLFAAGQARARADWLVGMNATRAYTLCTKEKMTVGRVQTPTLGILVKRERDIRNFATKVYWELWSSFETENVEYRGRWFDEETGNSSFESRDKAEEIRKSLKGEQGIISTLKTEDLKVYPPSLYNLDDLQQDANRNLGLTAARTLEVAQMLYEKRKLLTYPRTDSRFITATLARTIPDRLKALANIQSYAELAQKAAGYLTPEKIINDSGVTDHHAILPTDVVPNFNLSGEEREIYNLVARRFLSVFFPPAVHRHTNLNTIVKGHCFHTKGTQTIFSGWEEVYSEKGCPETEDKNKYLLPELREGMKVELVNVSVEEKRTKPPGRYTDATLLKAMKNAGTVGLGTPATRAGMIEKLISVGYIERSGKHLAPTLKGEELVDQVTEELKNPQLTSEWEELLIKVEQGKYDAKEFMKSIENMVRHVIANATMGDQK